MNAKKDISRNVQRNHQNIVSTPDFRFLTYRRNGDAKKAALGLFSRFSAPSHHLKPKIEKLESAEVWLDHFLSMHKILAKSVN